MKLKSGAYKRSRQQRALNLAEKQLKELVEIQESKGNNFPIQTRRNTIPVHKKIAAKKRMIENTKAAMVAKKY